uniref:G_PROTEIN_RECEP_F1_2 domain-containing protein n=1 Tax=Heterorhabditis bacteriophora TaxID=37862 RepID=A0A1I7WYB7_HETBA
MTLENLAFNIRKSCIFQPYINCAYFLEQVRRFAFFGVAVSTIATMTAIVAIPMLCIYMYLKKINNVFPLITTFRYYLFIIIYGNYVTFLFTITGRNHLL